VFILSVGLIAAVPYIAAVLVAHVRGGNSKCPRCGCERTHPSHRDLFERLLPGFVWPYRCEYCTRRFYVL